MAKWMPLTWCLVIVVLMVAFSIQHSQSDNHQHQHQHQHSHEHNHQDEHNQQHEHQHKDEHEHEHQQSIYTNKQASTCLTDKATPACFPTIKQCTQHKPCSQQLSQYQGCSFGTTQHNIFNGYCFRRWKQTAKLTKQLIECLDRQCNLDYNSVIGYQELQECVQQQLIENYQECPEECLEELHEVRDWIDRKEVEKLFNQLNIQNEAARNIISVIKSTCLNGEWKSRQQRRTKSTTEGHDNDEVINDVKQQQKQQQEQQEQDQQIQKQQQQQKEQVEQQQEGNNKQIEQLEQL